MKKKSPRILVITSIFPNPMEVTKGIYIYKQVKALAKITPVIAVAPVPFFPSWIKHKKYDIYARIPYREERGDLTIIHPRYLVIPKIGRSLYGLLYLISIFRTFNALKRSFDPDVCISYWAYPDGYAAVLLSKLFNIPALVSCRGCDVNDLKEGTIRWRMVRWALRKSKKIFAVSRAMSHVVRSIGVNEEAVKVIPNGIDTATFRAMDRMTSRNTVGLEMLNGDKRVVLYCGRLSAEKGPDLLLDAVKILNEEGKNIHLLYTGDGPLKLLLHQKVSRYRLEDSVTFLGEVGHSQIPYIINSCELLCLPSLSEGWPNTLMEAMACGIPVVATVVGGVPEIVSSGKLGILVPPGDSSRLARAISDALARSWDRNLIREQFGWRSWDVVASEILDEVKSVAC